MEFENIYKVAREMKGLTQYEAAEKLEVSWRSISNYETFNTIPSNEMVDKMVRIYDAVWLAYMHVIKDKYLGQYFPKFDLKDIAKAALKMQKEIADFNKVTPDMIEVAYDGIIEEHEKKIWNKVKLEAMDVAGAAMTVMYAGIISKSI